MSSSSVKAITIAGMIAFAYLTIMLLILAYSTIGLLEEKQQGQQARITSITPLFSSPQIFTIGAEEESEESDEEEDDEEELSTYDQQILEGTEDALDEYEEELNDLEDDVDDIEDDSDDADDESDLDDAAEDLDDKEDDVEYLITKISRRINLLEDIESDDAEDLQDELQFLKEQAEDLLDDIDDLEDDIEDEEDDFDDDDSY